MYGSCHLVQRNIKGEFLKHLLKGDKYVLERFEEVLVRLCNDSENFFFNKKNCLGLLKYINEKSMNQMIIHVICVKRNLLIKILLKVMNSKFVVSFLY